MVLSFNIPSQTVSESNEIAIVCVDKSNPSLQTVTASIADIPGTAVSPDGKEEDGSQVKDNRMREETCVEDICQ